MIGLTGTGTLVKLALRRDRIMLPVWVYALAASAYGSAASTKKLYPTATSRLELASSTGGNRATIAMYGPSGDLHTLGGLATWKLSALGAILAAVMSLLIVVRHTRADEEAGRLELVGAGVVGRHAPLTAGLLVAFIADLALAVLTGLGLMAGGLPASDSFAFGLGLAAAGGMFAVVAAVAAQLTESARTASGITFAVLGLAYLLRAIGDAAGDHGSSWPSWLSPIGWTQQVRPFGPTHWWVFGIAAVFMVAVGALAYRLSGRRDLGAGLLPAPLGPAAGPSSLRSSLALAWRLQRGTLLAWSAAFAVYGAAIGSVADGVGDLVKGNRSAQDLLLELGGHQGIVDAYLATVISIMGLLASAYAVQAALRLRAEETSQRVEPLLATPVGRIRWAAGHLVISALGTALLVTLMGLAVGLAHGLRSHDLGGQLPRMLGASLVQLPAALVLAGVVVTLFGFAPRAAAAAWGVLGACLLLGQLGPILNLSQWAMDLSPFTHVPKLPGGQPAATPLIALTLLAAVLTAAGLTGFRRRDLG